MPFLSSSHGQPVSQHVTVYQQPQGQSHPTPRKISVFTAFNRHAEGCSRCRHPLEVVRQGGQLCDEGHAIATDVARALYRLAGETASKYEPSDSSLVSLLVDLTKYGGPVHELCKAMDKGLEKRYKSSSSREPAVHYASPSSSSSKSRQEEYYTTVNSSAQPRRQEQTPRRSGNIRINLPIEYGQEASFYEEFCHSNGGKIITKYYHAETPRPQLARANTFTEPSSSKPARKSTVHFDPEVKYYK